MFDIGFSEVLLIFIIALVVLGPEKLPRLASQVGRWIGRARAMARQFREQLEEEVNLEQVRKAQEARKSADSAAAAAAGPAYESVQPASTSTSQTPDAGTMGSDAANFHADTFSHAHPTDEHGANPHTPDGAAERPGLEQTHPSDEGAHPSVERSRAANGGAPAPSESSVHAAPVAQPSSPIDAGRSQPTASVEAYSPETPATHAPGGDPHGQV